MRSPAHFRVLALCVAGCVGLAPSGVEAAEGDAQQRSAALFKEGVAAGKAGDYAHAEVAFRTAYSLVPSASTLRNWALTEMKMGKMLEALGHLKVAIQSTNWTAVQRTIVQENLDDAYAATGHLAVETTDGARVAIDGVPAQGTAPFDAPVDVAAGHRQIEARLGSETAHTQVDATAGRIVEVHVPIRTAPEMPATAPASAMPAPATQGPAPAHAATWWTTPHAVAVGLAATAAVGAGFGLVFDVASHQGASDANALRAGLQGECGATASPPCAALRDKIDTVHEEETLTQVGFAVAAAAGLGAVILLVIKGPDTSVRTGSVRWAPRIAPGAWGLAGSF